MIINNESIKSFTEKMKADYKHHFTTEALEAIYKAMIANKRYDKNLDRTTKSISEHFTQYSNMSHVFEKYPGFSSVFEFDEYGYWIIKFKNGVVIAE